MQALDVSLSFLPSQTSHCFPGFIIEELDTPDCKRRLHAADTDFRYEATSPSHQLPDVENMPPFITN